jgi:hypothetical protein
MLMAISFAAASSAEAGQNLSLDLHGPYSHGAGYQAAGPVSTTPLKSGEHYFAIVKGTASIWPASQWSLGGSICGASEEKPMFPSPGAVNGQVGWDAETVFAVPPDVGFFHFVCVPSQIPFSAISRTPGGFQINVGGGFGHVVPVGGERSTPTAGHTYTYEVAGTGAPASFRFLDDPVADDYGIFKIEVLDTAECEAIGCKESAGGGSDQIVKPGGSVAGAKIVALPASRACVADRARALKVQFRKTDGVAIASVSAYVNGRKVRVVYHRARGAFAGYVVVTHPPVGTFTLEVRVTTSRHQVLRSRHTYKACIARRKIPVTG